ncbi:hypothetical protein HAX54_008933 [Datura stramonium]|uniref:Uncharacterized protein n=1 Tax=Datura stramonium TaxID=4076 RepID=A0ABS8TEA7_DATST|nr:hypothetical protein [Datura stramonium]
MHIGDVAEGTSLFSSRSGGDPGSNHKNAKNSFKPRRNSDLYYDYCRMREPQVQKVHNTHEGQQVSQEVCGNDQASAADSG